MEYFLLFCTVIQKYNFIMSNMQFTGNIDLKTGLVHITLSLIEFKEDSNTIIYSPALDLSGYGQNAKQAKNSFNIALLEFVKYTNNKKTVNEVFESLGWVIKGSKRKLKFVPPLNTELIQNNETYSNIINSKSYKVFNESVELAY